MPNGTTGSGTAGSGAERHGSGSRGLSLSARLRRRRGPGCAARRAPRPCRGGTAVPPDHAEERPALLGADDQRRQPRLVFRPRGLSLYPAAPGERPPLAADPGGPADAVARRRRLPGRPRVLPRQPLRRRRPHGPAPRRRRRDPFGTGGVAVARRFRPLPHRRCPTARPHHPHPASTRPCRPCGRATTPLPPPDPVPPRPAALPALLRAVAGYPADPECCLVNHYAADARMCLHRDGDEETFAAPVVSLSLGDSAVFRIGGAERRDPTTSLRLHSGDVVVLAGPSRLAHHGIDRVLGGSSRLLDRTGWEGGGRINVTLRRVTRPPEERKSTRLNSSH